MKSSFSVSTTHGSFSGGSSVNVPPPTFSGRYFDSALPSTTTVPRSATSFVTAPADAHSAAQQDAVTSRLFVFMPG